MPQESPPQGLHPLIAASRLEIKLSAAVSRSKLPSLLLPVSFPPCLCSMALASPRDSSAASASRGASQPAREGRGASAAAPARGAPQPAYFTVASFNFGFEQSAMSGKRSSTHCTNFGRVCATIVEDADADLLFACEVGAFRQGLSKAKIHVEDILKKPFGDSVRFAEVNNYLSLWGFGGASQPALVSLHGDTKIYQVPIGRQVDAVIARFDVQTSGHGRVHVVTGNMHIVCAEHPPSVLTRQRAVRLLRLHLDGLEAPEVDTPVVRIMVGDNNLNSQQAREALQRHADDEALWEVFASPADRIGDNVAVCGAVARFRPIAVGASYLDRGMRNDSHDAVAVVITLRGASQPAEAKKREPAFGTFSDSEVSVSRSRLRRRTHAQPSRRRQRQPSARPVPG